MMMRITITPNCLLRKELGKEEEERWAGSMEEIEVRRTGMLPNGGMVRPSQKDFAPYECGVQCERGWAWEV